ncbi:unnamed protein product [Ectocarpus sp. CCAP 1310/34]|nr:unnamed protein product [Ectocarpus sp. CCAP 1310/34]
MEQLKLDCIRFVPKHVGEIRSLQVTDSDGGCLRTRSWTRARRHLRTTTSQHTTENNPDWVVTSPPYKGALGFVKAALTVAKESVALKLPLSFLEPCADREGWLQANPPALCMMMSRARYQPAHVRVGEFWGVWYPPGSGSSCSDI